MKYPEEMVEDVAVRPGMPLVGPGSKGKASPQGGSFSPWERKREDVFFVGVQMKGWEGRREDKAAKVDLRGRVGRSDRGYGRSDRAPYSTWRSDRSSLAVRPPATGAPETPLVFADLIHICTNKNSLSTSFSFQEYHRSPRYVWALELMILDLLMMNMSNNNKI